MGRALYNPWWRSKKMSLSGTSTILEFPVWRTEFGRVLPHPSGHLDVTVLQLQEAFPARSLRLFSLQLGLKFTPSQASPLGPWQPSSRRPALSPGVPHPRSQWERAALSPDAEGHVLLGSLRPLWTPLTMSWTENVTDNGGKTFEWHGIGSPLLRYRRRF